MMTEFKVGDEVTFNTKRFPNYKGTVVVKEIEEVPPKLIKYDPHTEDGGTSHNQWLIVEGGEYTGKRFSGVFFESDDNYIKIMNMLYPNRKIKP